MRVVMCSQFGGLLISPNILWKPSVSVYDHRICFVPKFGGISIPAVHPHVTTTLLMKRVSIFYLMYKLYGEARTMFSDFFLLLRVTFFPFTASETNVLVLPCSTKVVHNSCEF